ncbi:NAD(P)/FAD-dependent oxidoreductase [Micromonospora craniellae]|uniref:FAD-dependent oxidoreductase n=1 Tax=Micromonospora craniellae TaxID=2294034 RepID=A0A372G0B7_9ACTN|nr:FAD-dependent oxidoreductase [Micromonospora craniellae]QOC91704.1 FAD-dependent oxidoreductase [Micromonospora craniellae]RFS46517.1 FAD-dependent oxidoreductase [Micromonospora craniellae]
MTRPPSVTGTADRVLWLDGLPADQLAPRPPLDGDTTADVAIAGAGYTGLWTAYYLSVHRPELSIVVVDSGRAGFGASGRNGGWCTAEMPALLPGLIRRHGPMAAMRLYRAGQRTLDELRRVFAAEDIDAHWRHGGSLYVARSAPQVDRLRGWQEVRDKLGITGLTLTVGPSAAEQIGLTGVRATAYTPHCAAVQPARIARGLLAAVERRGVRVAERTRALRIAPGLLVTDSGTVRARSVLCATEGYTGRLPGHARRVLPLHSYVLATEPLDDATWQRLGLTDHRTVADGRYQFGYLQRTLDDRLVLGGRGAYYRFGSATDRGRAADRRAHDRLRRTLGELLPDLADVPVSHRWNGVYGLHRHTEPEVVYDRDTGLGHAGGYGGEGIALSNLAARSLAALVAGVSRPETRLCWVDNASRRWEPEPLRFVGVRGVSAVATGADHYEHRTDRTAPLARLALRAIV